LKLETLTFGTLEFEEKSIIQIQEGMLGFPHLKKYLLVEDPEIHPFKWLQSIEDLYVAFPVVDPRLLFNRYSCSLVPGELNTLGIEDSAHVVTLAVAVISEDPLKSTLNLKAPLLINHNTMFGKQVVLTDSPYDPWQPILSGECETAAAKG
jgi:flagellar assembly factor FliW